MPKSGYGARKSYARGYKRAFKKSSRYSYKSGAKRYNNRYKRVSTGYKPNERYRRQSYGYPSLKKGIVYRSPTSVRDQDLMNYSRIDSFKVSQASAGFGRVEVYDCLGDPAFMYQVCVKYGVGAGALSNTLRCKSLSQKWTAKFTVAPDDVLTPSTKLDNNCEVDLYFFRARRDVTNVWGSDWRTVFANLYTQQTSALTADLQDPMFKPFWNSIWCSFFKCVKKESFVLSAEKPNHVVCFKNNKPVIYDANITSPSYYLAAAKLTHVVVACYRGQLGIMDGAGLGSNLGYPTNAKMPKVAFQATWECVACPTELGAHTTYIADASTHPVGLDHVVVANVATEAADAN